MEKKFSVIPTLLDLALGAICKNINEYETIRSLPDLLRQKLLLYLFRFAKVETVVSLRLNNCSTLVDEDLKGISNLKNLTNLDLSHCDKLVGLSLCWVSKLPNLRALKMSHCSKMFMGFYFLQSIPSLRTLDVAFCEVPDPMVEFVANIPNLTNLNLMCNRITDEGAIYLSKSTQLKHLTLAMNPNITDCTLEHLSSLKGLVSLNLDFCKLLTGPAIEKLSKQLPSLEKLDIVGCDRATNDTKQRPLILLAEDNKIQAKLISMVLNRYNFDIEIAIDGKIALEMFRNNPKYDLILMDLMMPVMDGLSCVKLIREYEQQKNLKRTPIIIQTADPRESQRRICLEAGCDEFLQKPLDRDCITLAKQLIEGK